MKQEHKPMPGRAGSRRTVLASLAAGVLVTALPPRWKQPAVEAVLLPAHAQTSAQPADAQTSAQPGCGAPTGCYSVTTFNRSFSWPGGTGPFEVTVYHGTDDCSGSETEPDLVVVAASAAEAQALCDCESEGQPELLPTTPALPEGCSFFSIDTI